MIGYRGMDFRMGVGNLRGIKGKLGDRCGLSSVAVMVDKHNEQ